MENSSLSLPISYPVAKAILRRLASLGRPIFTDYDLGRVVFATLTQSDTTHPSASPDDYVKFVHQLIDTGAVEARKDFRPGTVFQLIGHPTYPPAELACLVDPFAYVSHLSAMEHYGLTDRFPSVLYLSTPPNAEWRAFATNRMKTELRDAFEHYLNSGFPLLRNIGITKIERTTVHILRRTNRGAFKTISDKNLRVATVGRTFLDMLREPQLCGGIQHVIDIYRHNAKDYLRLIVDEFDAHGSAIDKVRAGYLLTEVCQLESETFRSWETFAQRGGSRKLDAEADYSDAFSEKWKLSINVPSLMNSTQ